MQSMEFKENEFNAIISKHIIKNSSRIGEDFKELIKKSSSINKRNSKKKIKTSSLF